MTETDVGMARSKNRAVAQRLAQKLKMHYAFAPCYLSLAKGSGVEYEADGKNELGLHGNAVLSRYPIGRIRPIALKNGRDKMCRRCGVQMKVIAILTEPKVVDKMVQHLQQKADCQRAPPCPSPRE